MPTHAQPGTPCPTPFKLWSSSSWDLAGRAVRPASNVWPAHGGSRWWIASCVSSASGGAARYPPACHVPAVDRLRPVRTHAQGDVPLFLWPVLILTSPLRSQPGRSWVGERGRRLGTMATGPDPAPRAWDYVSEACRRRTGSSSRPAFGSGGVRQYTLRMGSTQPDIRGTGPVPDRAVNIDSPHRRVPVGGGWATHVSSRQYPREVE